MTSSARPVPHVRLHTNAAEDSLADAMDDDIMGLAKRLAGNDPANIQVVSRNRDGPGTT